MSASPASAPTVASEESSEGGGCFSFSFAARREASDGGALAGGGPRGRSPRPTSRGGRPTSGTAYTLNRPGKQAPVQRALHEPEPRAARPDGAPIEPPHETLDELEPTAQVRVRARVRRRRRGAQRLDLRREKRERVHASATIGNRSSRDRLFGAASPPRRNKRQSASKYSRHRVGFQSRERASVEQRRRHRVGVRLQPADSRRRRSPRRGTWASPLSARARTPGAARERFLGGDEEVVQHRREERQAEEAARP